MILCQRMQTWIRWKGKETLLVVEEDSTIDHGFLLFVGQGGRVQRSDIINTVFASTLDGDLVVDIVKQKLGPDP